MYDKKIILCHNYTPLLEYFEILPSKIHGYGLFTNYELKEKYVLGVSHIRHDGRYESHFPDGLIRTALGSFINHSLSPNSILSEIKDKGEFYLICITDIPKNTEITLNYYNEVCGLEEKGKCSNEQ